MACSAATLDSVCPGCSAHLRENPRYPVRFCGECLGRAVDGEGRRLRFANIDLGGGLKWAYAEGDSWSEVSEVLCRIGEIDASIQEAYLGGVIAVPIDATLRRTRFLDLR